MARSIRLQRSQVVGVTRAQLNGFRLRIEAINGTLDMPLAVFVYSRPPVTTPNKPYDLFMTVASFPDIAEYPEDNPDENAVNPFFRKTFVELDLRSESQAAEVWASIAERVDALVRAMDRADSLSVVETLDLGDGTIVSSSESEA